MDVTYEGTRHKLPLIVVAKDSVNLAGHNYILPFKLISIFDKDDTNESLQNSFSILDRNAINKYD